MENKYINEYKESLRHSKLSNNTIEAYMRDLHKLSLFLNKIAKTYGDVDRLLLLSYIQELKKCGQSESTITRNMISVKRFYNYLIKKDIIRENPTIYFEAPQKKLSLPETLTIEEVDKLLSMPDTETFIGSRDKAMLEILYATGMKISEMLNLTIQDVDLTLCYLKCRGIKNKERIIPLGSYAVKYVKYYLLKRDIVSKSDILFLNSRGSVMTRQGFWKIIKDYASSAEIEKPISTNTIRHSFALHLLENGADIKSVQELMGLSAVSSAQIYLNLKVKNKLLDIYKKSHPRA
jgi:integrase/recombinase XerD